MLLTRSILCLFLIYTTATLFSCRGSQESASTDEPVDNPTDTNASAPPDNTAGFSIKLKSTGDYTYILHKGTGAITDNFSEPCAITTADGSAASDIKCVVEARELDLFFNGVGFRYNVPQSLCEYVSLLTPYYYNFQPAVGPSTVIDNRLGTTVKIINGITANPGELKVGSVTRTALYCSSDYSNSSNPAYVQPDGGPNCCSGDYDMFTSDESDGVSVDTLVAWGGKPGNCLKGPAVSGLHTLSSSGYPKADLFSVLQSGLNQGYDVTSPIKMGFSSNIFVANYFNPADHVVTGAGIPVAFSVTGTAPATNPYHELVCYDRHKELKARIRLLVREWNLLSEYNLGATGDSDATGNEANFGAPPINDFSDIKDIGDVLNTSYPRDVAF
jgi:hypothetical protein